MLKIRLRSAVVAFVIAMSVEGGHAQFRDRSDELRRAIQSRPVQNILLFVGDGLGDSEITLARNYWVGAAGRLELDTLPFTGAYTTYSVQETVPNLPNYVPDSAATGTAWATGSKTSNGRISTTAATDRDLKTILEIAQERGWRTGNVTTAEITDATPAVLGAHVAHRSCQGPADMTSCANDRKSAGGPGSIAEQLIDHKIDVLMGGGLQRFEQITDSGQSVIEHAEKHGYRVARSRDELGAAIPGTSLLGLFAPGNLQIGWAGLEALPYPSNVGAPQTCRTDARPASQPTLADLTKKAIELLGRPGNERGFILQVEGASIDKQSHNADPCGQIGETIGFDDAVRVGLEFARSHPDTLLIVTGDHAHASQIVDAPTDLHHPSGLISTLRTTEGSTMTVSYATAGYHQLQDHTGSQIRIAATGPLAANVVGVLDQTDLFHLLEFAIPKRGQ